MLDRLLAEHRQIERHADALAAVLDLTVPDFDRLKDARWALAKAMMQHIAYEDRQLFLPLENHARPAVADVAKRFKAELLCSHTLFETHTARWTAAAMISDWPSYRQATREILRGLGTRIRAEEAELFPLARYLTDDSAVAIGTQNWARAAWNVRETLER